MNPWPLFKELAIALLLAFFFGLAFEDYYARVRESRPGGVRTFPMLALVGALLYLLDPVRLLPLTAGLISIGFWLGIYYHRHTDEKNAEGQTAFGLMVPVCNVAAFLLGPAAIAEPLWVPVGVTAAAVLFLTSRESLHRFAREIEMSELVTAGKFLVITGLVLPLLPDKPLMSISTITPRQAWLALIAVSGVSYASYLLRRYAWPRGGTILVAVLGGLYSSTATAIALSRQARSELRPPTEAQAGILLSTAVMYLRILVVVAIFNVGLARTLAPAALGLSVIGGGIAILWRLRQGSGAGVSGPETPMSNPLAISTAAIFAILFVVTSIVTTLVQQEFGLKGLYALAGVVGFADVDPFVLNLAQGGTAASTNYAAAAILVAASSNNVLKAAYTWAIAGRRVGAVAVLTLTALAAIGILAAALLTFDF